MSDTNQSDTGGLWDEQTRLPTLTPLNPSQRAAAVMDNAARLAHQVAMQEQIRALTHPRRAAEHHPDDPGHDHDHDMARVRVQWAETTRYEADLYVEAWASQAAILAGLADLPAGQRRVLTTVESDTRLVSVIDLDGDGHIDAYELSTSAAQIDDWAAVADTIDERIAESPGWPRLNGALHTAAGNGWAVATELPALAAASPLPDHDPAGELYYRLLNSGAAEVTADGGADAGQPPPRPADSPSHTSDAPRPPSPAM